MGEDEYVLFPVFYVLICFLFFQLRQPTTSYVSKAIDAFGAH